MTLENSYPWSFPTSSLAVEQIRLWHIRIFVARTFYTQVSAIQVNIIIEPFDTFPKELHVCGETYVALIACGIGHTYVKVIKIKFQIWSQDFLKGINVKTGCKLITDSTDYLEVDYWKGRGYHDSAEHQVVHVPVYMFHQLSVGDSGVRFQDQKGNLCRRAEDIPANQLLFRQARSFCHALKRKQPMKPI